MISKMIEIDFFQHYTIKQLLWTNNIFFKFWSFFGKYFFNSTYTRVDLYASIYGISNLLKI